MNDKDRESLHQLEFSIAAMSSVLVGVTPETLASALLNTEISQLKNSDRVSSEKLNVCIDRVRALLYGALGTIDDLVREANAEHIRLEVKDAVDKVVKSKRKHK